MNSAMGNALGTAGNALGRRNTNSMALVVFSLCAVVTIILVGVFIWYRMTRTKMEWVDVIKSPRNMALDTTPYVLEADKLRGTLNGESYSYSMWLYLVNFNATQNAKFLFSRTKSGVDFPKLANPTEFLDNLSKMFTAVHVTVGDGNQHDPRLLKARNDARVAAMREFVEYSQSLFTENTTDSRGIADKVFDLYIPKFMVIMDAKTNKLYIAARSNVSFPRMSTMDFTKLTFEDVDNLSRFAARMFVTATIDYVPLQRWVNITAVVQDNLLTAFLDGDLYTVENVQSHYDPNKDAHRPVFSGQTGDVLVGYKNMSSIPGFLNRLRFYNQTLTHDEVRAVYNMGPVYSSPMNKLGVTQYGIRTPVYLTQE